MNSHLVSTGKGRSRAQQGQRRLIEVEQISRYVWAAQLARGRLVLDAGCGNGYGSRLLATGGARSVIGVDQAGGELVIAAPDMPDAVQLQVGDLHKLEFEDGKFELVVCFEVIEYVEDPLSVLDELVRVLAPEGRLVVSTPNPGVDQAGDPYSLHQFAPTELEGALVARLSHVQLFRQDDHVVSTVLSEAASSEGDGEARDDLALHRLGGDRTRDQIYTVATASDAELPSMRDSAVMGGTVALQEWLAVLEDQSAAIAEKDQQIDGLAARLGERDRLTELLGEAEHRAAEIPELKQRIIDLELELESERGAAVAARLEADQLDRMLMYGRRTLRFVRPLIKPLRRLRRKLRG